MFLWWTFILTVPIYVHKYNTIQFVYVRLANTWRKYHKWSFATIGHNPLLLTLSSGTLIDALSMAVVLYWLWRVLRVKIKWNELCYKYWAGLSVSRIQLTDWWASTFTTNSMNVRLVWWALNLGGRFYRDLIVRGPFYKCGLTWIPTWISNYIQYEVSFPNCDGATVEVWEWISGFILLFTRYVITNSCTD